MALEQARLEHTNTVIMAHPASACEGQEACPLHNRSVHPLRAMTQSWRSDRKIVERACEHGNHPDPDQWWFWLETLGEVGAKAQMVHGCSCSCCGGSYPWW